MINLFSDTQTRPTPAMRRAMAEADVGDEQRGLDPTTVKLQETVAGFLGKDAALFLPSGSMCNLIAVKVHTSPGDAVICDRFAHIVRHESGAHGVISGVLLDLLDGDRGRFTAQQVEEIIPYPDVYSPPATLVCVEQTHNFGGGSVWPIEQLRAVCAVARKHKLRTHMDGARLLNACAATGISSRDYAREFDSVWIDLSKGLGCPVGAVLAGSADFINIAARWKQALGGGMRQSGIIAAAGIYALQHHVDRLVEDQQNAKLLARGLSQIAGITLDPEPETNMVFFRIPGTGMSADQFCERLERAGVSMVPMGTGRVRAVTHLDVDRSDIERAIEIVKSVVGRKQV
jgi:threonine aldolase